MRILIADDDPVSRRLLESALLHMGHEVLAVSDGTAAAGVLLAADGPRIAILDWMMPGADGLAVCRAIRQRKAPYVYVILLTSRDRQEDMVAALDAEVDDFLTKPFDAVELRGRLHAGERILTLQEGLLQAQDELRHEATHDCLTGLWNRRMILEQLDRDLGQAARDRSPLSVVIADVDRFKRINDTHGHPAGDAILQQVARRLQSVLRDRCSIGRYGGEEFLIVLPACNAGNAAHLAERARACVAAERMATGDRELLVSVSMGVASTLETGRDPRSLIAAADAALYRAKVGGRDQVSGVALSNTA